MGVEIFSNPGEHYLYLYLWLALVQRHQHPGSKAHFAIDIWSSGTLQRQQHPAVTPAPKPRAPRPQAHTGTSSYTLSEISRYLDNKTLLS